MAFTVYSVSHHGFGDQRGTFETFAAAHARAIVIIENFESVEFVDVHNGDDEVVWDNRNGRVYV